MATLAEGRPTGRRGWGMTIKGRSDRPEEAESEGSYKILRFYNAKITINKRRLTPPIRGQL